MRQLLVFLLILVFATSHGVMSEALAHTHEEHTASASDPGNRASHCKIETFCAHEDDGRDWPQHGASHAGSHSHIVAYTPLEADVHGAAPLHMSETHYPNDASFNPLRVLDASAKPPKA